jgi:hypothetical protein
VRRDQLEHILRAACQIIDEKPLLVIGSQAILGTYHESLLPPQAVRSIEADVASFDDPGATKADRIEGALGQDSEFHAEFGVYAEGVTLATAVLPVGWQERLVPLDSPNTRPGAGMCIERHDLVLSKLARGDRRDYDFASALVDWWPG